MHTLYLKNGEKIEITSAQFKVIFDQILQMKPDTKENFIVISYKKKFDYVSPILIVKASEIALIK